MIDQRVIEEHNLTLDEYEQIVRLIGREPNLTELGIFSLMWSEHCSYKSSKVHLKKLPTQGAHVVQGPGENAGVLDIGDGLVVVFKIESHNHPSFIEPFQGAATGVGGILRDIFTMGARPIALLDSLRFGPLENPKNRAIMEGVVAGISSYGNSIGVPTVGGEVYFHECFSKNPLVNVFCLGIARKDRIFLARAEHPGNAVLYVGSKTGRDGIHGATMASAEFGKETEQKRPTVQVGDPFKEKLLLEACLEVMEKNLIVGIQDMGAAGLACSTSEIAAKSRMGISIDLDVVPQREVAMTPYEIMLSESQERMLIIAPNNHVEEVQKIFAKWDLDAVKIGEVTAGERLQVTWRGEEVVNLPVEAIVNLCPSYTRPSRKPSYLKSLVPLEVPLPPPRLDEVLLEVLSSPTIADKEWLYKQYDHMVQVNTVLLPGADAAVLRLKGQKRGLALTLDGNSTYTYLNPRVGGKIAVAEACRNLASVGAKPIGVTNCLNFGNPEKTGVMWQFKEVIAGMAEACRAFSIPVTGGNVSFYNETEGVAIHPTPVLGVVGLLEEVSQAVTPGFKEEGDLLVLLGENREELGGSRYLKLIFHLEKGEPPQLDLEKEKRVQEMCREAISQGLIRSAHDISEGGLVVCASECTFHSPKKIGCLLELEDPIRSDALLFGETQSRILVSIFPSKLPALLALAAEKSVKATVVGKCQGKNLVVRHAGREVINLPVATCLRAWKNALPQAFAGQLSSG